jgi:type I restriction enzyme S subunit
MMEEVLLTSICRPKQWKTIASTDLHEFGYPVYGANGKIGFYNTYTHEHPTVLITCRGATCGTINICEPKSYVNGNAMALDNLSNNVDLYYLKHYLEFRKLDDVISGSAQPQITGQGLSKVKIPLPPLPQQQKIANILDAADALRQNDKALITKYDELTQSLFLDMFGDINNNIKFPICTVEDVVAIVRDGPHVSPKYSDSGIPILSTRNIRPYELVLNDLKYVSPEMYEFLTKKFRPQKDDVLLTKGGTTGYAKHVDWDWDFCIWVHLAALRVKKDKVIPKYLEASLNSNYCYDQSQRLTKGIANKDLGLKQMIKIQLPLPPLNLQNKFAERIAIIEEQKAIAQKSLEKSEELFNSLLQKAFKGELV